MAETYGDKPDSEAENDQDLEKDKKKPEKTTESANMEDTETKDKHQAQYCRGGVFGPPHFGRPRFMRRLRRLVSQMEDTTGSSSDSDSDQPQEATNEEKTCDSKEKKVPRKECRRAWRRFMRHQMRGCPRHAFYGGGPQQAWLPPWASPAPCCPTQGRPMVPPPMLHKLRRILTAMEAETGPKTEDGKDSTNKTSDEKNNRAADSTHRQARLQAQLRRLIDYIEHQGEDDFPFFLAHPRMRGGPGCGMMPCHMRRMLKRMGRIHRKHGDCSDENTSEEETNEPEDIPKDTGDTPMTTTNPGPLEDWQDLRQDVEDLEAEGGVSLVDVSEACPTCGCSAAV